MKTLMKSVALLIFLVAASNLYGQEHGAMGKQDGPHVMLNAGNLQWMDAPASIPKGAKAVILEGNPANPGPFTLRLMLPANYEIKPHWHPAVEHVSVLEGSFYMGLGDDFNKDKATALTQGGFAVMPAKFVHYAFTKEGATIQLHGMGPWGINYVKASDDPRNQGK